MGSVRAGIALIAIILSVPAAAQDGSEATTGRTPEGAHRFIDQQFDMGMGEQTSTFVNDGGQRDHAAKRIIKSAPSDNICKSHPFSEGSSSAWDLDWDSAIEVAQDDGNVAVTIAYNLLRNRYTFILGSADRARRFAAAASYLKDHCDKSKSTGF